MNECERSPLPPVLPALAEDLDLDPRRPHREGLGWLHRAPCPDETDREEANESSG